MEELQEEEVDTGGLAPWMIGLAGVFFLILLLGAVGHLVGIGFLGHRLLLHGEGDLYVLNLTPEELFVSVDGRPLEVVHAQNAQIVQLIGGTSRVEIYDEEESFRESYEVRSSRSHGLLNLSEEACLVVADISSMYGEGGRDAGVEIVRTVEPGGDRVIPLESFNVVWPRRTPPARMAAERGPMLVVEIVGCPLLEDPGFLKEFLVVRIQDRMEDR